jgi:Sjoegren syndrome nuclear autoantigen 1
MAEHGAALQTYNNELVKCIEDLNSKRDDVSKEIKIDEAEKDKLEHDIAILHERLQKVNLQLARKIQVREEYVLRFIKSLEISVSTAKIDHFPALGGFF